ncbi:MAG: hypothetical protein ACOX9C_13080 [Kiritimatiellia bacterium]|jgi:hypothetical protein
MSEEVFLYFVRGFHKSSVVPPSALKHNFLHRFAIVFDTTMQTVSSPHFPLTFFVELLRKISVECNYTNLLVRMESETAEINMPVSSTVFIEKLSTLTVEPQPPEFIEFYNGSALKTVMGSEMWVNAGGELPYADSYTISFYTPIEQYEKLCDVCIKFCTGKATILEKIEASKTPLPSSRWKRLLHLLRRQGFNN